MTKLRGFLTIVSSTLLAVGAAGAAEPPPRDLHQEPDGHWTAWDPPDSFPEGATVYTVVRGDTLWDLAGRFYGDSYLWPQLWEQNRWVVDAHWIYPGDPLLIDVEVTTADEYAEQVAQEPGPEEEPSEPGEDDRFRGVITAGEAAGRPLPLGAESDVYCSGYIGPPDEEFPYALVGSEHETLRPRLGTSAGGVTATAFESTVDTVRFDLANGDIVYIDGGRAAGLDTGQLLSAVQPGELVPHPLDRSELLGQYYEYLARVRVLSVQDDTAIGEIVEACAPVHVGTLLRPFVPQPVPLGRQYRMRPANMPSPAQELVDAPVIVRSEDRVVSMGQGNLVYVDRGAEEDVLPGDIFTIYRLSERGHPPVVVGELAVLSAEDHTALARILESRYTVYVGDRLERK
ncbi:MAG: LysM peptidoglycan-binding domain-containing protein [Thermoanaerobaculia bacterium]